MAEVLSYCASRILITTKFLPVVFVEDVTLVLKALGFELVIQTPSLRSHLPLT